MVFTSPEEHKVIAEVFPTALVQYPSTSIGHFRQGYDFVLMLQTSRGNMTIGWYTSVGKFLPLDKRHLWSDVGGQEMIDKYAKIVIENMKGGDNV